MMKLSKREETARRYDNNREINELISKLLCESIEEFEEFNENIPNIALGHNIFLSKEFKDVPYGENTLGNAGCAVFCFEQGSCVNRKIESCIENLAKEIADKGYYYLGRGTWHNLFDHYGLRRISHIQEIFDSLKMEKIVTLLIKNSEYPLSDTQEGSHFVNLIGVEKGNFIIADSNIGTVEADIKSIFKSIEGAWMW